MRSYRTSLDLNNKQVTACLNHAGAARWAYNWGLGRKIETYRITGKSLSAIDLHRELNKLKKIAKSDGGVPWLYEVSKCAPQEALRNLDKAFDGFFRRCKSGVKKKGFPKFKSRKRGIGSFTLTGSIKIFTDRIQLPRLGILRFKERGYLPVGEKASTATISERAGKWFVSVRTNEPEPTRLTGSETLGIDVGIKSLAVLSDGTRFENPKALIKAERRVRLLQKSVSRKMKGSTNRRKAIKRLANQHYRISCIRADSIHKVTSAIAKRAGVLVIESLNVAGMLRNRNLARSLSDASLAEIHRQLEYKLKWSGGTLIKANKFYPSSKTCSSCGQIKKSLGLTERTFRCSCGLEIDRDLNAAINLRNLAGSSPVSACRQASSGLNLTVEAKLAFGQEPNANQEYPELG